MRIFFSFLAGVGMALLVSHFSLGVAFVVFGVGITFVMLSFMITSVTAYRMMRG